MPTPVSKEQYAWEASGICLDEAVEERALGLPPLADPSKATAADMAGAAKYGDGLMPALKKKRDRLNALQLPAPNPATGEIGIIRAALHYFSQTVDHFDAANKAAHAGDVAKFRHHWTIGREHDQVADALFVAYEVPICAYD